mmetsp:Transcript_37248/g.119462  ORF Transcript_37248/g.119462 Transcript_37248/m.119462 type:complete len:218 (-) Transcript_37248:346-999(-)
MERSRRSAGKGVERAAATTRLDGPSPSQSACSRASSRWKREVIQSWSTSCSVEPMKGKVARAMTCRAASAHGGESTAAAGKERTSQPLPNRLDGVSFCAAMEKRQSSSRLRGRPAWRSVRWDGPSGGKERHSTNPSASSASRKPACSWPSRCWERLLLERRSPWPLLRPCAAEVSSPMPLPPSPLPPMDAREGGREDGRSMSPSTTRAHSAGSEIHS